MITVTNSQTSKPLPWEISQVLGWFGPAYMGTEADYISFKMICQSHR